MNKGGYYLKKTLILIKKGLIKEGDSLGEFPYSLKYLASIHTSQPLGSIFMQIPWIVFFKLKSFTYSTNADIQSLPTYLHAMYGPIMANLLTDIYPFFLLYLVIFYWYCTFTR